MFSVAREMQNVLLCGLLVMRIRASVFDEYFSDVCTLEGVYSKGSCYRFVNKTLPWKNAEAECEKSSGHLAQIDSLDEQDWVAQELESRLYGIVWIGGYDQFRNGTWRWISNGEVIGPSAGFINWGGGEPNNYTPGEDCMSMEGHHDYGWNDRPCSHPLQFAVCETTLF